MIYIKFSELELRFINRYVSKHTLGPSDKLITALSASDFNLAPVPGKSQLLLTLRALKNLIFTAIIVTCTTLLEQPANPCGTL